MAVMVNDKRPSPMQPEESPTGTDYRPAWRVFERCCSKLPEERLRLCDAITCLAPVESVPLDRESATEMELDGLNGMRLLSYIDRIMRVDTKH